MSSTRDLKVLISAQVNEFGQYVAQNYLKGRQGDDPNANFISRSALERYWTLDRVRTILLQCQPPVSQSATDIVKGGFICVFSILVYIGWPAAISQFTTKGLDDHHLPFTATPPDVWPKHPPYVHIYNEFRKEQWAFTPLEFQNGKIHRRTIEPLTILPVEYEEELGRNSGANDVAVIWKVKIHDECKGYIPISTVVFKVYNKTDQTARDIYNSETGVYPIIDPAAYGQYIVKCHGSFEQENKCIIILEYAPGGSLLDFLERTRLPNHDEVKTLWAELFELFNALLMIHDIDLPDDCSNIVLLATHHDIQPVNILVFPRDPNSEYGVYFKLADFGTARIIKRLSQGADTQAGSNDGNRMYTAPESCPVFSIQDQVPKKVAPIVDVWGLGAVFSEVLIWSILGEDGRERYRKERMEEIQGHSWMKGSGYDACFHDGTCVLKAVISMHEEALLYARRIDTLTEEISKVILTHMLQPSRHRLDSRDAQIKASEVIDRARKDTTPSATSKSPSATQPSFNKRRTDLSQTLVTDVGSGINRELSTSGSSSHHSARTPAVQGTETPETEDPDVGGFGDLNVKMQRSPPFSHSSHQGDHRPNASRHVQSAGDTRRPATVSYTSSMLTPVARRSTNIGASGNFGQLRGGRVSSDASQTSGDPNPTSPEFSRPLVTSPIMQYPITMPAQSHGGPNPILGGDITQEPRQSLSLRSNLQTTTCGDVYIMLLDKKQKKYPFKASSKLSELMKVRGMFQALSQITAVKGREQVLLIDDFTSMESHKVKVAQTARVISYCIKRADPNNMELYFASNVFNHHQCKTSTDVENIIKKHKFADGQCPMGHCLSSILNHIWTTLRPSSNPVSIYVLTDGIWETNDDHIGRVIAGSASELAEKKIFPPSIMIQFIRFGDSPVGYRRLKRLDDNLVKEFQLGDYDIVDTKNGDDHVSDILLGSISRKADATERGSTPVTGAVHLE